MSYFNSLMNQMLLVRKDVNDIDFTAEFIENNQIIKELSDYLSDDSAFAEYIPVDLIESYNIIPKRITMEQRRNLVLGINFFHSSEFLDQHNSECYVYNETDLDSLIKRRTQDFEYMIVDQKPEYFNDYTKRGIKEEAYTYYKKGNRFRKK